ncbi:MAG: TIGR00645 family protein [Acetobacteraceae bacterium]
MRPDALFEKLLIASRWLLAPLYLGLAGLLALFCIQFAVELVHLAAKAFWLKEVDLILAALNLIDLALIGGLIVMVMLTGYENFVSRLSISEAQQQIAWLGKLDAGTLKLKVSASIVAISAIELLKNYMRATDTPNDKLMWMIIIHLTFVVSTMLMAVVDRLLTNPNKG